MSNFGNPFKQRFVFLLHSMYFLTSTCVEDWTAVDYKKYCFFLVKVLTHDDGRNWSFIVVEKRKRKV
jgi:hypothetical protein